MPGWTTGCRSSCAAPGLEAYPLLTTPGQKIAWDEIHVGSRSIFAAAGLVEVNRPTKRRIVMRIDFEARPAPKRGSRGGGLAAAPTVTMIQLPFRPLSIAATS